MLNFRETFLIPTAQYADKVRDAGFRNCGDCSFYTWEDQNYRDFIMSILTQLEPIFIPAESTMFRELEEIQEVIFVQQGTVHVGFEVNRRQKFVVQFANKVIIGAYNCTFNKKTIFVYKSVSDVSGYMLRKQPW